MTHRSYSTTYDTNIDYEEEEALKWRKQSTKRQSFTYARQEIDNYDDINCEEVDSLKWRKSEQRSVSTYTTSKEIDRDDSKNKFHEEEEAWQSTQRSSAVYTSEEKDYNVNKNISYEFGEAPRWREPTQQPSPTSYTNNHDDIENKTSRRREPTRQSSITHANKGHGHNEAFYEGGEESRWREPTRQSSITHTNKEHDHNEAFYEGGEASRWREPTQQPSPTSYTNNHDDMYYEENKTSRRREPTKQPYTNKGHGQNEAFYEGDEVSRRRDPTQQPSSTSYNNNHDDMYYEENKTSRRREPTKQPSITYTNKGHGHNEAFYEGDEALRRREPTQQPSPTSHINNYDHEEDEVSRRREPTQQPPHDDMYYDDMYYDEDEASKWMHPNQLNQNDEYGHVAIPDAVWLLPSGLDPFEILGEKKFHLNRIKEYTETDMEHNESENRIEMWGITENIEEAIKQWQSIAEELLAQNRDKKTRNMSNKQNRRNDQNEWNERNERNERNEFEKGSSMSGRKGWAKPNKPPPTNKKTKLKLERRKARKDEEEIYKKPPKPGQYFRFQSYFVFPDTDIPFATFFGKNEANLHSLRAETKCHILHDVTFSSSNKIKIIGDSRESVEKATERVRNIFIKVFVQRFETPMKGWTLRILIEPPQKPYKIRIANPPPMFPQPYNHEGTFRLLEPVYDGELIPVVGGDNTSKRLESSFDLDAIRRIRETNIKTFEDALVKAFESIHLFDGEIKMRIRFGHVCLTRIPHLNGKKRNDLLSIVELNEKVLKRGRTETKFATCLATDYRQLSCLTQVLSRHNQEWNGSPFREFKIHAIRKVPGSTDIKDIWECSFDVRFDKLEENSENNGRKYKIGLWNATAIERNLVDITVPHLDNEYSWKLNVKTAKRLVYDKLSKEDRQKKLERDRLTNRDKSEKQLYNYDRSSAQGNFVHKLRFCPKNRLVYSNTKEVNVVSICEKTKWKYWWGDDYVVEVTKYELWDVSRHKNNDPGIENLLSKEPSPNASFGVTLYKKSWQDKFATNNTLKVGETPDWHPHDITEETGVLLSDIKEFLKLLQQNLPTQTVRR